MNGTKMLLLATALVASGLVAGPARAGDFAVYGSYWDTKDLGETAGGGVKFGFGNGPVRFDLRGTYFPDLSENFNQLVQDGTGDFKVKALVPEAGVSFNFAPDSSFQPYLGGGVSYYLLDTNRFNLDNEVGYYGLVGFHAGGAGGGPAFFAEGLYRSVKGTVRDNDIQNDIDLDLSGVAVNAGVLFRF
ncbi:MAG TPA: hypothetical protein VN783_03620 [Thermoanaerobaculia bacterium]|nr:hypothetical protein [Thermoanaerobaculia bacterium]